MSDVFCAPLDDLAVLELKGGQPDKLLQGQITADLRLLTPDQALPGLLCSLKGRVISSFEILYFAEDHLALVLPADNLDAVTQHLKKYEPFFRTHIEETTQNYELLGLSGKETPALLASLMGAWPKTDYHQFISEAGAVLHLPGPLARGLVLLNRQAADYQGIADKLKQLTQPAPPECWKLLDIQVGRAQVDASLADQYLPQMLNFQALGAVSFKKGCYIGQEIVARAQFRGQVKKRLYRAHLVTSEQPEEAKVYDAEGKAQGEIIQTAPDRRGELEALVVINQKAIDTGGPFFADANQSQKMTLLNLPYNPQDRVALHGAEA
ncbi:YgfZ/GcvT domain-containing protein [Marinospirillum perlucidum]|uniref:CAF17-like 4Fe-4S cluster assembly/insertion protein YgfZ n=1 Tax=Marinospirillum perlucidum TaxID=1982602 RepID=UPI000DF404CE|nr:folate-binding protein YgfZ [Marinospirillum perlucidum]